MGQDLNPHLSGSKTLALCTSVLYHLQAGGVRNICPITCYKKKNKLVDLVIIKLVRKVINAGGPYFMCSLPGKDQAESYILWCSGLSYVWGWVSYLDGRNSLWCRSSEATRGGSSGICTLSHGKWVIRELHASLAYLLLFLSFFFFFNVTSVEPGKCPAFWRTSQCFAFFLPPSRWASSKHIEGRLHLECRELSDLTVLPFFPLRNVSRSHFKPGTWF